MMFNVISHVPSCLRHQEEEPQPAYPMSFTWASHIYEDDKLHPVNHVRRLLFMLWPYSNRGIVFSCVFLSLHTSVCDILLAQKTLLCASKHVYVCVYVCACADVIW